MKDLNATLQKISVFMHERTGYSIQHTVLAAREELGHLYNHDLFIYNSDEWQFFLDLINEACLNPCHIEPIFVAATKTDAINYAKQGLRLNDKTWRLKNSEVEEVLFNCKCGVMPAIKVTADTDMQEGAEMTVGICKKHAYKIGE